MAAPPPLRPRPRPTPAAGLRGGLGAGGSLAAEHPLSSVRLRGLPAGGSLREGKQPQELRNSSLEAAWVGVWVRGGRQSPSRGSL